MSWLSFLANLPFYFGIAPDEPPPDEPPTEPGEPPPGECDDIKDVDTNPFFFLPPWWKYLSKVHTDALGQCVPTFSGINDIWPVALAILDMLLRLAGFIAVVSIIWAGVSYITASGNPEKAGAARGRIYNSLIGLAIVLIATAVVSFIGRALVK